MPVFTSLTLSCAMCFISGSLIIWHGYLEHKLKKLTPLSSMKRTNNLDKNVEKLKAVLVKDIRLGTTPVNHNIISPTSKNFDMMSSSYPQRILHNPPSCLPLSSSCPTFPSVTLHTSNLSIKKYKQTNSSSTADKIVTSSSNCFSFTQDLFTLCEYFNSSPSVISFLFCFFFLGYGYYMYRVISLLAGLNSMFQST